MRFKLWLENIEQYNVVHNTTPEYAIKILQGGFSLNNFGKTAKKIKADMGQYDPKGFFFTRDEGGYGHQLSFHPWKPNEHGVIIYATITLQNPLKVDSVIVKQGNDYVLYKKLIAEKYGKTGMALTKALQKDGYDGIVTDSEIIVFNPNQISINYPKTIDEIQRFKQHWEKSYKSLLAIQ